MTLPIHFEFKDKNGVLIEYMRDFSEADIHQNTTDRRLLAKQALKAVFNLVVCFEEGNIARSKLENIRSIHFLHRKVTMDTLKEYISDGGCVDFNRIKRLDGETEDDKIQRKADIEQSQMVRMRYVFPRLFVQ